MPLSFPSQSHGNIAFGFFNIEIDMLLLEDLFFFAPDFCSALIDLAQHREASFDGWRIDDRLQIGNLHGAIAGVDLAGFIGETYRRFPFPARPEAFKQNPQGTINRDWAAEHIASYGQKMQIVLSYDEAHGAISIADYLFDEQAFAALVDYVERGGYPRWKDDLKPEYVVEMMQRTKGVRSLFSSIRRPS